MRCRKFQSRNFWIEFRIFLGIFGTIFGQSMLNFGTVFEQFGLKFQDFIPIVRTEFSEMFSGVFILYGKSLDSRI